MKHRPKILVVGSFVMDLIVSTSRFPNSGETVLGVEYNTASGGKGANQAVQAARLGADVSMIGKVGEDPFGNEMIQSLKKAGVDVCHVFKTTEASSAIGNVQIEKRGTSVNNRIIVVPGANMCLTTTDVAFLADDIKQFDLVLLQQEIPMEVNEAVVSYAGAHGVPVMLNPAPVAPLSNIMLSGVSYLSPNEHEAEALTGIKIDTVKDASTACQILREKGCKRVLITLGGRGAIYKDQLGEHYCPALPDLPIKDTTAAGDSFIAAFCVASAYGMPAGDALVFATHTAGLTVCALGAQPSLPRLDEVLMQMKSKGVSNSVIDRLSDLIE